MSPPAAQNAIPVLHARDWALILLLALLWGGSFLFYELGLTGFAPLTLVFLRMAFSTVTLLLITGGRMARLHDIWADRYILLGFGLFGCMLPFTFYAHGQVHVTSSMAGIINSMVPLFTFLLASLMGQEAFRPLRLAGICLGIIGVTVLLGPSYGDGKILWGGLLCVLATLSYAVNTVWLRKRATRMDPQTCTLGMILGATLLSAVAAALVDGLPTQWPEAKAWIGVICLGIFCTALAFKVFVLLTFRVGASNSTFPVLLVPVAAVILGTVFLDEEISPSLAVGAALILLSLPCMDENLRKLLLGKRTRALTS